MSATDTTSDDRSREAFKNAKTLTPVLLLKASNIEHLLATEAISGNDLLIHFGAVKESGPTQTGTPSLVLKAFMDFTGSPKTHGTDPPVSPADRDIHANLLTRRVRPLRYLLGPLLRKLSGLRWGRGTGWKL